MERKIGEIFEYNGEWFQCVESKQDACTDCAFNPINSIGYNCSGSCAYKKVIFKKLEKVGEPCTIAGTLYQHYKVFDIDNVCGDGFWWVHNYKAKTLTIEIKQNKEDMGDNDDIRPYDELFSPGTVSNTKYLAKEDMEENKLNLKPFDIQKAKEGKPVCTRDGRKARIICFDAKDSQPIIGLYEKNIDGIVREYLCSYHTDGRMYDDQDTGYDLMMLPEKKEGWVNVYKKQIHNTFESAEEGHKGITGYIKTIKVEWEE